MIPEYPRILNWAVEGCLAWQHQRLGWCEPVESASAGYFEVKNVRPMGRGTHCARRGRKYGSDNPLRRLSDVDAGSPRKCRLTARVLRNDERRHLAVKDSKSNGQKCLRGISLKARPNSAANEFGVVAANDVKRLVN